jgi:creatinine amidohydrolase
MSAKTRSIGELTFADISQRLRNTSILCLPLGAIEQHGPHLPLNTDVIVAEAITEAVVARWGDKFDLWVLPTVSITLSEEHDWAAGTLCLSPDSFVGMMRDLAREISRSLPARNLLIVNGHGGNRRVLETIAPALQDEHRLNVEILHPFDLNEVHGDAPLPDVHAGWSETSIMLAVAPHLVRADRIKPPDKALDPAIVRELVSREATAWRSNDPRISHEGVIGDARESSAQAGKAIIASIAEAVGALLRRLAGTRG